MKEPTKEDYMAAALAFKRARDYYIAVLKRINLLTILEVPLDLAQHWDNIPLSESIFLKSSYHDGMYETPKEFQEFLDSRKTTGKPSL